MRKKYAGPLLTVRAAQSASGLIHGGLKALNTRASALSTQNFCMTRIPDRENATLLWQLLTVK